MTESYFLVTVQGFYKNGSTGLFTASVSVNGIFPPLDGFCKELRESMEREREKLLAPPSIIFMMRLTKEEYEASIKTQ